MSWSWFGKALIVGSAFPFGIFLYAVMYMDPMGMHPWDPMIVGSLVVGLAMLVVGILLARKK
jgi:hypothetical protein